MVRVRGHKGRREQGTPIFQCPVVPMLRRAARKTCSISGSAVCLSVCVSMRGWDETVNPTTSCTYTIITSLLEYSIRYRPDGRNGRRLASCDACSLVLLALCRTSLANY